MFFRIGGVLHYLWRAVDQDDVVTAAGQVLYLPPTEKRADNVFYRGVRLPYQKFNRNPNG